MSALAVSDSEIDENDLKNKLKSAPNYNSEKFMDSVSTKKIEKFGNESENIILIDTGTKNAIIRNIHDIGYNTVKVPWDTSIEEILKHKPKGVVISNGPGDPENCQETISTAKSLIQKNIPTLGICLGAKKCIAVQFHPEASPGPYDCKFVFDELKNIMEEGKAGKT